MCAWYSKLSLYHHVLWLISLICCMLRLCVAVLSVTQWWRPCIAESVSLYLPAAAYLSFALRLPMTFGVDCKLWSSWLCDVFHSAVILFVLSLYILHGSCHRYAACLFLLNVKGQVSGLYKRTVNITLLILNVIYLDSWQGGTGILMWDVVSIREIIIFS